MKAFLVTWINIYSKNPLWILNLSDLLNLFNVDDI